MFGSMGDFSPARASGFSLRGSPSWEFFSTPKPVCPLCRARHVIHSSGSAVDARHGSVFGSIAYRRPTGMFDQFVRNSGCVENLGNVLCIEATD